MKNYYYILGIENNASESDIKKAYRKLSIKFHPDKNKGDKFFENRFKEIQEAYETLLNRNKRIIYDSKFKKENFRQGFKNTESNVKESAEIISFDVSRTNISDREEITFFWATKNITKVKLSCFDSYLPPTGKKTLKINAKESKELTIHLRAYDISNKIISDSIRLNFTKKSEPSEKDDPVKEQGIQNKKESKGLKLKSLLMVLIPFLLITILLAVKNKSNQNIESNQNNSNYTNIQNTSSTIQDFPVREEELSTSPAKNNSSHESLLDFISKLNNGDYKHAYRMTSNLLWKNEEHFTKIAWGNLTDFKILSKPQNKYYESKWNADEILNLKFSAFDSKENKNRILDFDFHMIKILDNWEIRRMIYSKNPSPDSSVKNYFNSLFKVDKFLTDSSAICTINAEKYFGEDDYLNEKSKNSKFRVKLKKIEKIDFNNTTYKFLMFETVPTNIEDGKYSFCDHAWCNGYLSIARYNLSNNTEKLEEFLPNCECGKNNIFRKSTIPRFNNIDNLYLVLDAKRVSTHSYNCVDCENTAQICNALDLGKNISFSLGGTRYTKSEFNLDKITYVIEKGKPKISSNEGLKTFYEINDLFITIASYEDDETNNSNWYEDDSDFNTRFNTSVRIANWPYDLLQKYYDNFSSMENTKSNSEFYADGILIHHDKELISKQEALERDYNDFRNNGIKSYQILVKPASMITNHYDEVDIVRVPVMYYVTKTNGERSKFELDITAVLDKSNTKIYAIGRDITVDKLNAVLNKLKSKQKTKAPANKIKNISHGQSPYSYCYGSENNCNYGCSKISVKASYNSDVIVIIKKNDSVFRNAFITKGRTFEFNLPNGTYQPYFYYGSDWNNEKYMKETSCGSLYGGFNEDEHFGKDSPQYLNNNILTYELVLQQNGNFSTKSSNLDETF